MPFAHPARRRRGVALIVLALASGCAVFRGHGGPSQPPVVLVFTNETIDQAAVFATVAGGAPLRIGTIIPGRTDTLYLRQGMTGSGSGVNITARLLGRSSSAQTGSFTVYPGDTYLIRLPFDGKNLFVTPP